MEVLKLSSDEIGQSYFYCERLRDLILALEKEAQNRDRVVCQVRVNGLSLSESDEVRLGESEISSINEIEVETESIGELKKSSVQTVIQLAEALSDEVIRLADVYRGEFDRDPKTGGDARSRFVAVIKNTQTLTEALIVLKPILEESGASPSFSDCWRENENHMIATLHEMTEAFQTEDWALLADVLEYELSTTLDKWRILLVGENGVR